MKLKKTVIIVTHVNLLHHEENAEIEAALVVEVLQVNQELFTWKSLNLTVVPLRNTSQTKPKSLASSVKHYLSSVITIQ